MEVKNCSPRDIESEGHRRWEWDTRQQKLERGALLLRDRLTAHCPPGVKNPPQRIVSDEPHVSNQQTSPLDSKTSKHTPHEITTTDFGKENSPAKVEQEKNTEQPRTETINIINNNNLIESKEIRRTSKKRRLDDDANDDDNDDLAIDQPPEIVISLDDSHHQCDSEDWRRPTSSPWRMTSPALALSLLSNKRQHSLWYQAPLCLFDENRMCLNIYIYIYLYIF